MITDRYKKLESGVWLPPKNSYVEYSDGDEVERRLLRNIIDAQDVSLASDDLQRQIIDWPSEYHFSPLRVNLLSSFALHQFSKILEVGSGCGAISRLLGERCQKSDIIALEGSLRRAEITRARCRDLDNVQVCCDSFADFESTELFDLITMIGVLEYSPAYFKEKDAFLGALKRARDMMQPNGVLVIAIENQLGLKYFNGCAEDHTGRTFTGINDLYTPNSVRTLGRLQLKKKLEAVGFQRVDFVYPFPDYKLPQLLLREDSFNCESLGVGSLVGQYPSRDYGRTGLKLFNEARVWNLLDRNGLLRDLANSFLVFAFNSENSLEDLTDAWLAKTFSSRRKKEFLVETVFEKEGKKLSVTKKTVYPRGIGSEKPLLQTMVHRIGKVDYIEGVPYGDKLHDTTGGEDILNHFFDYLEPWIGWLRDNSISQPTNSSSMELVSGSLYDCMPANFLVDEQNHLNIIDQEWEHATPLDLGFIVFRAIYREVTANLEFFEQSTLFCELTIEQLLHRVFSKFSIPFNNDILNSYIDLEIDIQLQLVVYNSDEAGLKAYFNSVLNEKRIRKISVGEFLDTGEFVLLGKYLKPGMTPHSLFEDKEAQIARLNQIIAEQRNEIKAVFNSSSWRLTAPLRLIGYLIRGDFSKAAEMRHAFLQSFDRSGKRRPGTRG